MGKSKNKQDGSDDPRWAMEFGRLWVSLQDELGKTTSDRTAVIVGVSLVDSALEMLLRHFFKSRGASQKECDRIFTHGENPPVQSFGLRIRFAQALGLIEPWIAGVLRCLKGYRNKFAHEAVVEPLTDEDAKRLVGIFPEQQRQRIEQFKLDFTQIGGEPGPRWTFIIVCAVLNTLLVARADASFGEIVPGERGD